MFHSIRNMVNQFNKLHHLKCQYYWVTCVDNKPIVYCTVILFGTCAMHILLCTITASLAAFPTHSTTAVIRLQQHHRVKVYLIESAAVIKGCVVIPSSVASSFFLSSTFLPLPFLVIVCLQTTHQSSSHKLSWYVLQLVLFVYSSVLKQYNSTCGCICDCF